MNPITQAIKIELDEAEQKQSRLQDELATVDLHVAHLENLLRIHEAGPHSTVTITPNDVDPLEDQPPAEENDDTPPVDPTPEELEDAADGHGQDADPEPEPIKEYDKVDPPVSTAAEEFKAGVIQLAQGNQTFTIDDAKDLQLVGESTVPKRLKDLVDAGELIVAVKGSRRGPAQYALPGYESPAEGPADPEPAPEPEAAEPAAPAVERPPVIPHRTEPTPTVPAPSTDTHTTKDGRDADEVIFEIVKDEAPLEYHEIVTASGINDVTLVKAALSRLKAAGRIEEGDDGKYRWCVASEAKNAQEESAEAESHDEALRSRILRVLKAHNGAGEKTLTGLLNGVEASQVAAELKRMQEDDLVSYSGLFRQWKVVED